VSKDKMIMWPFSHVCCPSSERTESRCKQDTNIPNIHGEIKCVKDVVDDATGSHETWIHSSANYTTEGVPCSRVKPVPKFLNHPAPQ
jgi:hypothetical protein